jgi:hypothetical protein
MLCREQVVQLHGIEDKLAAKNAHLVVIGNGAPNFIAGFRKTTGYTGTLYTDPSLATYKAAAFTSKGAIGLLSPKVIAAGIRAMSSGHFQGTQQGDAFQNGGVYVVKPSGEVSFSFVSQFSGDHPSLESVLAAL